MPIAANSLRIWGSLGMCGRLATCAKMVISLLKIQASVLMVTPGPDYAQEVFEGPMW